MNIQFTKAVKEGLHVRLALFGPAGSGKTYSALKIAAGIANIKGGRICVIDTEHRSASKYADAFDFDTFCPTEFSPQMYTDAITAAERAGYSVIVIDSLSHAWSGPGGALEMVDAASARNRGNSYAAWREVTPQHNKLVDKMLRCNAHLIVTMRSKTAYTLEEYFDQQGNKKTRPVKVGLQPVQRDGMEYEFDIVADMDQAHTMSVGKSRCTAIDNKRFAMPGDDVAETLMQWVSDAKPTPEEAAPPVAVTTNGNGKNGGAIRTEIYANINAARAEVGYSKEDLREFIIQQFGMKPEELELAELMRVPAMLRELSGATESAEVEEGIAL